MAGGNLSPRQKMIGMMYLVLTALLALNVSKDILNAFVIVNSGLETTTKNFSKKNDVTYSAFNFALKNNENKVKKYWEKAQATKKHSSELIKYIEELKKDLFMKVDGLEKQVADTITLEYINAKDNMDIPGQVLVGSTSDGKSGKARELKNKIIEYKNNLKLVLKDVKGGEKINFGLNTDDPPASAEHGKQSWETHNFDHTPFAAVITLLSKLQSDTKNAEADVVNHLYSQIDAGDFKFDTLAAKVVAPTSYVLLGNEYTADIFVGAFSTTQNPIVEISPTGDVDTINNVIRGRIDTSSVKVKNGVGKYTVKPTAEGVVKWGGIIKVKSPDGSYKAYSFKSEFIAAKPNMVVSADKMNVLYIGVENPMSISVPGVPTEKITASISTGSLTPKGKGSYVAFIKGGPPEATISVTAEISGKKQSIGSVKYRVKRVPDPVARVAGRGDGPISKAVLGAQQGVAAVLENFDFDLRFNVTSFMMTRSGKGRDPIEEKATGPVLTPAMKAAIQAARLGDKIYFEQIKAVGPDGSTRNLGSISFVIQ